MGKPPSMDLRDRIIAAIGAGLRGSAAARHSGISCSSLDFLCDPFGASRKFRILAVRPYALEVPRYDGHVLTGMERWSPDMLMKRVKIKNPRTVRTLVNDTELRRVAG